MPAMGFYLCWDWRECIMRAQAGLVGQMEWNVRRVLGNDTAAISTLRCLKLYLERLGCNFLAQETVHALAGSSFALVSPSYARPPQD